MIKRATWFVSGAVAGATGMGLVARRVKRRVRRTVLQLSPTYVARHTRLRVRSAVADGRRAMLLKEAELRARRDGTPWPPVDTDPRRNAEVIELRPRHGRERRSSAK